MVLGREKRLLDRKRGVRNGDLVFSSHIDLFRSLLCIFLSFWTSHSWKKEKEDAPTTGFSAVPVVLDFVVDATQTD